MAAEKHTEAKLFGAVTALCSSILTDLFSGLIFPTSYSVGEKNGLLIVETMPAQPLEFLFSLIKFFGLFIVIWGGLTLCIYIYLQESI